MQDMLPPGTWCTDWAFDRAVATSGARSFLDVGCGEGRVAASLCARGLRGIGLEPAPEAAAICREALSAELADGRFTLHPCSVEDAPELPPVDLAYSQMVLEHIPDDVGLLRTMAARVRPGGTVIAIVPARPECWGSEDDLAGHVRRYDRASLTRLFTSAGLGAVEIASLNVPVSNVLKSLSNRAVDQHNGARRDLELDDRTRLSGLRDIPFKNRFPGWARLVLNPVIMWPLCQLQRVFFNSDRGLVLIAVGRRATATAEATP